VEQAENGRKAGKREKEREKGGMEGGKEKRRGGGGQKKKWEGKIGKIEEGRKEERRQGRKGEGGKGFYLPRRKRTEGEHLIRSRVVYMVARNTLQHDFPPHIRPMRNYPCARVAGPVHLIRMILFPHFL
jgi:hypothetical protein